MGETPCMGSGQPPAVIQSMTPCHVCGATVPVYMRRMDWTSARDLYLGDHPTTPENVEEPPPGKHRQPPTLSMERAGEAPCPDCWTPENVESPT